MDHRVPVRERIVAVLLTGGLAMFLYSGCQSPDESAGEKFANDRDRNPAKEDGDKKERKGVQFAEDRALPDVKPIPFDGKRAMQYLTQLCDLGPRLSASPAMRKQQELLKVHFEKLGATVTLQKFEGTQPSQKGPIPMANMIITWNPDAKRRVLFAGHYDTRPIADQELRERDWYKPFISANDGTSTVAFMMELAHHMKDLPRNIGLDFIIFDGEEYIFDKMRDKFFLGSDYFAKQYAKEKRNHDYIAGVLLDLFAGKNAQFPIEVNSRFLAGPVLESVWMEAERQGVKSFIWKQGPEVQDDHLALNRVRIPTINIIDFEYAHWHKLTDLPENCSGDTMVDVAKVLTAWVQRLK